MKPASVPKEPEQRELIARLTNCTEDELLGVLHTFTEWTFDKVRNSRRAGPFRFPLGGVLLVMSVAVWMRCGERVLIRGNEHHRAMWHTGWTC